MLYRVFLVLTFGLALSCKAPKKVADTKNSSNIFGTWNYKESSGGFTGKGTGWDNQVLLYLGKDLVYERKENLKVVESDRFKLTTLLVGEDSVKVIDLANGLDKRYRLSGDTLFLDEMVSDGYSYTYLRSR